MSFDATAEESEGIPGDSVPSEVADAFKYGPARAFEVWAAAAGNVQSGPASGRPIAQVGRPSVGAGLPGRLPVRTRLPSQQRNTMILQSGTLHTTRTMREL